MRGDFKAGPGFRLEEFSRAEIQAEIRKWSNIRVSNAASTVNVQGGATCGATNSPLALSPWLRLINGRAGVDGACVLPWPGEWALIYEVRRHSVAEDIWKPDGSMRRWVARGLALQGLAMMVHATTQLRAQGFEPDFIQANSAGEYGKPERVADIPAGLRETGKGVAA